MKSHALKPALTTAAIAALCVLGLAGCAAQGLPYPKPTSATQVNADFLQAAKSGNYDQLNAITESSAQAQAISIAKQAHKKLSNSKCTVTVNKKPLRAQDEWITGAYVKCPNTPQYSLSLNTNSAGSRIVRVYFEQALSN